MTIQEALCTLGISDYSDRILNSNSHGELFHLMEYAQLADFLSAELKLDPTKFRTWFVAMVEHAEKTWMRPESVFQHVLEIFKDTLVLA